MFRMSTTPIVRSTQNCKYNLRYWSYFCAATSLQRAKLAWPRWREVAAQKYEQYRGLQLQFCVLLMTGAVDIRNM